MPSSLRSWRASPAALPRQSPADSPSLLSLLPSAACVPPQRRATSGTSALAVFVRVIHLAFLRSLVSNYLRQYCFGGLRGGSPSLLELVSTYRAFLHSLAFNCLRQYCPGSLRRGSPLLLKFVLRSHLQIVLLPAVSIDIPSLHPPPTAPALVVFVSFVGLFEDCTALAVAVLASKSDSHSDAMGRLAGEE